MPEVDLFTTFKLHFDWFIGRMFKGIETKHRQMILAERYLGWHEYMGQKVLFLSCTTLTLHYPQLL